MTLTTHALVGAAAASLFPAHPYAAFAAGFASHFLIDALPHRDYGDRLRSLRRNPLLPHDIDMPLGRDFLLDLRWLGGDAFVGFVLTFFVAWFLGVSPEIALVGAGAGIYPDLLQFVYFKIKNNPHIEPALRHLQRFHERIQEGREHMEWSLQKGLALQVLLVVLVLAAVRIIS